MLKKTMTYTDYDGNSRTEDFYFNISKAEIIEMQFSETGGLDKLIKKIMDTKDYKKLIDLFKNLIKISYGEKSLDGRTFEKSEEIFKRFEQTEAYSDLFMELATNTDAAINFLTSIVPSDLAKELDKGKIESIANVNTNTH